MYIYPPLMEAYAKERFIRPAYWGDGTVREQNGDELQDSLNPFYNNSTNFYKYYFQATKSTECQYPNITIGSERNDLFRPGLGYYDEEGILKGTGYSRSKPDG